MTMVMARRATAQWDISTTMTMVMGDNDDDVDDGDVVMGNKVVDDGNDDNYGDGQQQRLWPGDNDDNDDDDGNGTTGEEVDDDGNDDDYGDGR